jgi:hypothetical protein
MLFISTFLHKSQPNCNIRARSDLDLLGLQDLFQGLAGAFFGQKKLCWIFKGRIDIDRIYQTFTPQTQRNAPSLGCKSVLGEPEPSLAA